MSLSDFPRYPLMFGPSPVHPLERLTAHLGGAQIWAKREDCNSGLAFGGNKTRKLEYLVPDALAQGATHLVSIGGVQSNHTRQVAAVAAKLGLKARLVQESWVNWPDAVNDRVGNILLSRIMGARRASWSTRASASASSPAGSRRWTRSGPRAGRRTRSRPGASDHRLGGLGFANWAYEVQQQEAELGRLLRHDHRVQRHRLHPRRDDRRVRRPGPAAPGDRHRRLGQDRGDPRPGRQDRPEHRRADRPGPRPARRRDHRAGGLGRRPLRHPGAVHPGRDPADRPPGGHDHRPGVRGQVDGRPDRPGPQPARSAGTPPCCTPTSAASPR